MKYFKLFYIFQYYEDDTERLGLPAPSLPDLSPAPATVNLDSSHSEDEAPKVNESFDIKSIIDGLDKDDKPKERKHSYPDYFNNDVPLKKRIPTGGSNSSGGSNKILTKAALKHPDSVSEHSGAEEDARSLNNEFDRLINNTSNINNSFNKTSVDHDTEFDRLRDSSNNISYDHDSSRNDSLEKSDNNEDSPHQSVADMKEKDCKKTKLLGKIFVSTPERKRSEEVQSEETIMAVLNEDGIYNIEALVAKKGHD